MRGERGMSDVVERHRTRTKGRKEGAQGLEGWMEEAQRGAQGESAKWE